MGVTVRTGALEPDCLRVHPDRTAHRLSYSGPRLWAPVRTVIVRTRLHAKLMVLLLEHKKCSVRGRYHVVIA